MLIWIFADEPWILPIAVPKSSVLFGDFAFLVRFDMRNQDILTRAKPIWPIMKYFFTTMKAMNHTVFFCRKKSSGLLYSGSLKFQDDWAIKFP